MFFNRRCSICQRERGFCPHTNPNISDRARENHSKLVERKFISQGGAGDGGVDVLGGGCGDGGDDVFGRRVQDEQVVRHVGPHMRSKERRSSQSVTAAS